MNSPPTVKLVLPQDGATFFSPATVQLVAQAEDTDGFVQTVEFFAGDRSLGTKTNNPASGSPLNPFMIDWPIVTAGEYSLTAKATDDKNATATSSAVKVTVIEVPEQIAVDVVAVKGEAREDGDSKTRSLIFRFSRTGTREIDVPVVYSVTGTATAGQDFAELAGKITIPKGSESADLLFEVLSDTIAEPDETVIIRVEPPACIEIFPPPPDCYKVGTPSEARGVIAANDGTTNQRPSIEWVNPASGAVFQAPADITIEVSARDPDGIVNRAEIFAGETKIGEAVPMTLEPPQPGKAVLMAYFWKQVPAGQYLLWAKVTDENGAMASTARVNITVRPVGAVAPFVAQGSEWKYFYAEAGPGDGWRTIGFDDTAWRSGKAELGYGDGDEVTKIEAPAPRPITAYFRHVFEIPAAADATLPSGKLVVRLLRDDGAAVYLNGREVVRNNLPDGPLNPGTLATSPVGGEDEKTFKRFELGDAVLSTGPNIVAVEVHQVNASSSDISFDLELLATDGTQPAAPVVSIVATAPETSEPAPNALVAPGKFKLSRSGSTDLPLTVRLGYDGTAVAGVDYETLPAEVTIPAGAASTELLVLAKDDDLVEVSEYVSAVIMPPPPPTAGNPPAYLIAPDRRSAKVLIRDNDQPVLPVVSIVAATPETIEPSPNVRVIPGKFVVSRTGSADGPLFVWLAIEGTALNGTDYTRIPQSLVFEEGVSAREIFVSAIDDDLVEGDETVVVAIVPLPPANDTPLPPQYTIDPERNIARVVIHDNEQPITESSLVITAPHDGAEFTESDVVRIDVTAVDPIGDIRLVEFYANGQFIGKSEHLTRDAIIPGKPRFHVFEWQNVAAGQYDLIAKAKDTAGKEVLSSAVHISVVEKSDLPVVSIKFIDDPTDGPWPDADFAPGSFQVTRTGATSAALQVNLAISGTATPGVDYAELPSTVTIAEGQSTATFGVDAKDDELPEGEETVVVTLRPLLINANLPANAVYRIDPEHATAQAVIFDNDVAPPGATIEITAPRDGQQFADPAVITISATAVDPKGYIDYVEFHSGDRKIGESRLVFIQPPEPGTPLVHTFEWRNPPVGDHRLTARSADPATGVAHVVSKPVHIKVTTAQQHIVVRVDALDSEATEMSPLVDAFDSARFVITRDGGDLTRELLVFYSLHGTAQPESDYRAPARPARIPSGERSVTVEILPVSDETPEPMETVALRLEPLPPLGAPIGEEYQIDGFARVAVAVIYDRAAPADGALEVALPSAGAEYHNPQSILILAAAYHGSVDVEEVHFYANDRKIGTSLVQLERVTEGGLILHGLEWKDFVPGEYVITARSALANNIELASSAIKIVIGGDSVLPVVSIRFVPLDIIPLFDPATGMPIDHIGRVDFSPGSFEITRTGSTDGALPVFISVGGTATPDVDYAPLPNPVAIPAGQRTTHFKVDAKDDGVVEGDETVVVSLISPPTRPDAIPYRVDPEHATARAVIFDGDSEPTMATLEITSPTVGQRFVEPAAITISATAIDPKGYIPRVEFYAGSQKIGVSEIAFIQAPEPGTPIVHTFEWKLPPSGAFALTARTVDSAGGPVRSNPVGITVVRGDDRVVVAVEATDPKAAEAPGPDGAVDTATFTIKRIAGTLNIPVTVFFELRGTAQNGIDYKEVPDRVVIESGQETATVTIVPVPDKALEGDESVTIRLQEPICVLIIPPPPGCYQIGHPGEAHAIIIESGAGENQPPHVVIGHPKNGAVFQTTDTIEIRAEAIDRDGTVAKLEILAGDRVLGTTTESALTVRWEKPAAGSHTLIARAVDDKDAAGTSEPVNIYVRDHEETAFVRRDLPPAYAPGVKFQVQLRVDPPSGAAAYAVEDKPPHEWTVSGISDDGAFDPINAKVKFGPFTDREARTLVYDVTPPATATGRQEFRGAASIDGRLYPIGGDRVVEPTIGLHPADLDPADNRITVQEVTAYTGAWKEGAQWSAGPVPIPMSYVTRAGALWKGGELYSQNPAAGPAPLWWVNVEPRSIGLLGAAEAGHHGADRESPPVIEPGQAATIRISVAPRAGVAAYAVEEHVPIGWTVRAISHEGRFDVASRRIRWGLFLDDTARVLTFEAVPPADKSANVSFEGWASFDGMTVPLGGSKHAAAADASTSMHFTAVERTPEGKVRLRVRGRPNQLFIIEASADLLTWSEVDPHVMTDEEVVIEDDSAAGAGLKFYRTRPLPGP